LNLSPAGASEAEMDAAIAKAISESGANSVKHMGAVVKGCQVGPGRQDR